MGITILHTADLHLGSFPGPEHKGENERYKDLCKSLAIMSLRVAEHRPDIMVISGDLFHQAKVWSDRGLKENRRMIEFLRDVERYCPVVVMRGTPNHDSAEQFSALQTAFENDERVKIITEPGVTICESYYGSEVQIACVPGFDRGYYRAKHPGLSREDENDVFTAAIEDIILGLKAQTSPELPTVLMGHYTITGANMESGQTAFLSQFEPVVYPNTLQAADFDLVCFGHIHRPQKIEGCKNTFYSGAISALNFNDEGQERGYYIHEIAEDHSVTSTFYTLPTREFLTINLDNDAVTTINAAAAVPGTLGYEKVINAAKVRDKIIRVLYDCTDEQNKAFNHALLEEWLYMSGAFWVQEITPRKITITVDKQALEAEDGPEDNLTAYLTEKEYSAEDIGRLIELARPLIAEVMEKNTTEKQTGTFIPLEIEVKNYRNYREEKFSYDNVKFCTINGKNGVGKSSLFMDAILDCLFEQPREGDLTGWICNAPDARSGAIKLTFRLGEKTYRVTRTRAKSGKATLNIAELVDGEWQDRSAEKLRDTQTKIENVIGIDSLTLKACALIMQDQYGIFLQADKEARMNILGNILGLGIYADMEDLAASRLTETNRTIRQLEEKAETIMSGITNADVLSAQIDNTEKAIEKLKKEREAAETAAEPLREKQAQQQETAEKIVKLKSRITGLTDKQATKQAQITAQEATISSADAVIAKEAQIQEGVKDYADLQEKEKELISIKAEYKNFTEKKSQITDAKAQAETEAKNAREKRAAIFLTQITPLKKLLENEAELTAKHAEYIDVETRIAEMVNLEGSFRDKTQDVLAAENNVRHIGIPYDSRIEAAKAALEARKRQAALLDDSKCPLGEKATCEFLKSALEAKAEIPGLEKTIEELEHEKAELVENAKNELNLARKILSEELYSPTEIALLRAKLSELLVYEKQHRELATAKNELAIHTERCAELNETATAAEKKVEGLAEELKACEGIIQIMTEKMADYASVPGKLAAAKIWIEQKKQLPLAKERKAAAEERLMELNAETISLLNDIADTQAELAKCTEIVLDAPGIKVELATLAAEIRDITNRIDSETRVLGGLIRQAKDAQEKIAQVKELQASVSELAQTAADYDTLKKAFSQDGIPHNIIRSIIPVFEATATNILGQMSGGKMSVEFVTEKVLKSNSKKEVTTLDIIINDVDTGRLPYMSRSGGERVKSALAVILALSEIKSSKAGVQLGFLFIDEPPFLDAPGIQAYVDALETIQARYSHLKIMAITHDMEMKSRFPQSVDIVKTADGSKILYD
ncbi:MAG: metallophosphoesterase [Clostridia bacterium]|nr:metallophosphoesterase [Clostridia bacterium]